MIFLLTISVFIYDGLPKELGVLSAKDPRDYLWAGYSDRTTQLLPNGIPQKSHFGFSFLPDHHCKIHFGTDSVFCQNQDYYFMIEHRERRGGFISRYGKTPDGYSNRVINDFLDAFRPVNHIDTIPLSDLLSDNRYQIKTLRFRGVSTWLIQFKRTDLTQSTAHGLLRGRCIVHAPAGKPYAYIRSSEYSFRKDEHNELYSMMNHVAEEKDHAFLLNNETTFILNKPTGVERVAYTTENRRFTIDYNIAAPKLEQLNLTEYRKSFRLSFFHLPEDLFEITPNSPVNQIHIPLFCLFISVFVFLGAVLYQRKR